MKHILSIFIFSLIVSGTFAQLTVPAVVLNAFSSQYPGVSVEKWEEEDETWEAGFTVNNLKNSVVYNEKGELLETEIQVKVTELPSKAIAYLNRKLPGQTITEAAKITIANGTQIYEAEINHKDYFFDASGKTVENPGGRGSGDEGSEENED
jgi:flagellar basal body-associated protein FliL